MQRSDWRLGVLAAACATFMTTCHCGNKASVSCTPKTCAELGLDCGPAGDGCGAALDCGSCIPPYSCGGGGTPSVCGLVVPDGGFPCTSRTCADQRIGCGPAGDGCGNLIQCGTCSAPQTCGGGGVPSECGGNSGCIAKNCAEQGFNCGPAGDGCGGQIDCGTCTAPDICGGGGTPGVCGAVAASSDAGSVCSALTCADLGINCGPAGDGCGGQIDCGTCTSPQTCGGGGQPSVCGGNSGCVGQTCAQVGFNCGPAGDGCGGTLNCGTCTYPSNCGGGGTPGVCGFVVPDGGSPCTPLTCAQLGFNCGPAGDGCGGALNCGSCAAPQTCGGGGMLSVCGGNSGCVSKTCGQLGFNCGPAGDGCGGTLSCGTCSAPTTCGGGGKPGVCGAPACVPKTCVELGFNCGPAGDGCGGLIANCGTCLAPEVCGAGAPGVCGVGGLLQDGGTFVTCTDGGVTSISGVVVAGTDPTLGFGQPDPIYNAYVYVPAGPLDPIITGATCDRCTTPQNSIVSVITGIDGKFTLVNPPVGPAVPLVIQLGKWQREISVNVTACQDNPQPQTATHLPRNRTEGNIPRFAIDTGSVDVLECVLRKMGIQDSEFTDPQFDGGVPTASGRVHVYHANPNGGAAAGGAVISANTPTEDKLWTPPDGGAAPVINNYDIVLFPCEGGQNNEVASSQANVINYANAGGRIFATHFSYVWLYNDAPFSGTATWRINSGSFNGPLTGHIDQSFPKGTALAQWLQTIGASTTAGQIPVNVVRHDFNAVVAPSQRWMYTQAPDPAMPIHYTFDTPVGAAANQQCGRVVFSDFHVENAGDSNGVVFPAECTNAPMTPQEKLLEFMLFDLSSCIQPDVPTCTPATCAQLGYNCGPAGDGCGGQITCGTCSGCQACGGGGSASTCGGQCCQPLTCTQLGVSCGPAGDGCGGQLDCGTCVAPQTCGGGGTAGVCGAPACEAQTCSSQGISCGPAGDGCGNQIDCGACAAPLTCGGGGFPGQCGLADAGACAPLTCGSQAIQCGPAGDGCGGLLSCGTCVSPQTCGGGGQPGVCGQAACSSRTCASQNINCGPAGDGCGGLLDCGSCPAPETCGGGGMPGQCGVKVTCTPTTCAKQSISCGPAGDGCGGLLQCGSCVAPQTCGGGGKPGVCGQPPCKPLTCAQLGYDCGPAGDGCGGQLDCGTCTSPQSCGGGGQPGVCGPPLH